MELGSSYFMRKNSNFSDSAFSEPVAGLATGHQPDLTVVGCSAVAEGTRHASETTKRNADVALCGAAVCIARFAGRRETTMFVIRSKSVPRHEAGLGK